MVCRHGIELLEHLIQGLSNLQEITPPRPDEVCRLFLRRNVRMRNADVAGEFVVVGGVSPSPCTYTWEGIVRKRRCRGVSVYFLLKRKLSQFLSRYLSLFLSVFVFVI
ncbi:hypothetical protein ANCCAN_27988 [Ancylostoma caninum]|uniref:Uncharacterized protein n=1 Tax=Ancylostoma caninum TaxID=29170 RepID=A0A368F2G4_ANCCA|nr:hypothetical protein ANCCAN_27988 [Ancylostoma caninum]